MDPAGTAACFGEESPARLPCVGLPAPARSPAAGELWLAPSSARVAGAPGDLGSSLRRPRVAPCFGFEPSARFDCAVASPLVYSSTIFDSLRRPALCVGTLILISLRSVGESYEL